MFFEKKQVGQLDVPPLAKSNGQATEVLRVWTAPGIEQQVILKTNWKDPGSWGLLLADIAQHAANAYANEGYDRNKALARIRELLDAELAAPTDIPEQIPED